jgi:hypothetical protein
MLCLTDAQKPHLAACGVAAAWRLGRWQLLESYLQQTRPFMGMLVADDQWEVRLGELLAAFHHRCFLTPCLSTCSLPYLPHFGLPKTIPRQHIPPVVCTQARAAPLSQHAV